MSKGISKEVWDYVQPGGPTRGISSPAGVPITEPYGQCQYNDRCSGESSFRSCTTLHYLYIDIRGKNTEMLIVPTI